MSELNSSEIRHQFFKWGMALLAGTAVSTFAYAHQIGRNRLVIEKVTVPLPGIAPALHGFKIAQLSDFHLHPFTKIDLVKRAVSMTNELEPDLVALTGDYVLSTPEAIFELAPVLAQLEAKYGVYAVLGNHDSKRWTRIVRWGLEEAGVPVLLNQGKLLTVNGARLYVAGLDDCGYGQPDLPLALADAPSGTCTILLVHEPDFADRFALDGRIRLQLSGHTHGGQIRLPWIGPIILPVNGRKYHSGLYQVGDMWLYTNRGIGVNGIPARLNCSPEITEITLVSRQ